MKAQRVHLLAFLCIAWGAVLEAQTLDSGGRVFTGIADGAGLAFDDAFVLAPGGVTEGFVPGFEPHQDPFGPGFEGLGGCLWVENPGKPVEEIGRRLTRWDHRIFPSAAAGFCGGETPVPRPASDIPEWGIPGGVLMLEPGAMQSYTVVPEASSALLLVLTGGFVLSRRRAI